MEKVALYISFLIVLLLSACTSDNNKTSFIYTITINPDKYNDMNYDSIVSSLTYIPLENSEQCVLGEITNMAIGNNAIAVVSQEKQVYCFDIQGNYRYKLGAIGRASGEYIEVHGISYDNGVFYVYDSSMGALLMYDADSGKFIDKIKFPYIYAEAFVKDDYIYATDYLDDYVIVSMPLEKPEKVTELYRDANKVMQSYFLRKKITNSDGRLFWTNPLYGMIYELNNGTMVPFLKIDFGKYSLPLTKGVNSQEIQNSDEYALSIGNFAIAGSVAHVSFSCKGQPYNAYLNLDNSNVFSIVPINYFNSYPQLRSPYRKMLFPKSSIDGCFCYLAEMYFDYIEVENLPLKYDTYRNLSSVIPNTNPFLVKFGIKF